MLRDNAVQTEQTGLLAGAAKVPSGSDSGKPPQRQESVKKKNLFMLSALSGIAVLITFLFFFKF